MLFQFGQLELAEPRTPWRVSGAIDGGIVQALVLNLSYAIKQRLLSGLANLRIEEMNVCAWFKNTHLALTTRALQVLIFIRRSSKLRRTEDGRDRKTGDDSGARN